MLSTAGQAGRAAPRDEAPASAAAGQAGRAAPRDEAPATSGPVSLAAAAARKAAAAAPGAGAAARKAAATAASAAAPAAAPEPDAEAVGLAIADLIETFGPRYPNGPEYLARLDAIRKEGGSAAARDALVRLQREALLANPLLDFGGLLLVKRRYQNPQALGLPTNHECNTSLARSGYENELAVLAPVRPEGDLRTLYRPPGGGYVGEADLDWDGRRLLFTQSDAVNWKIWEMRADGTGLRQVSRAPDDVDCFDACWLPDGRIVFGCTASFQSVPCWHGLRRVSNLYLMNADGAGVRQLCFDQDHDLHPCVLADGQVVFSRWDYTGISHIYLRELMVMNPDGTGQRAVYGSNSWYPNSLYFPRPVPGERDKLICILSGYHGVPRMGNLVLVDTARGWYETDGLVQRIPGRGRPLPRAVRDNLVDDDWPKFLTPWPLSGRYFLAAAWLHPKGRWGLYLADVFDNLVLIREEPGCALLEPVPLQARPRPPAIPDKVVLGRKDAVVFVQDVYAGRGLAGVPRGTIKGLRLAAYHFGYPGLAGPDLIGYGGPWEAMRILGTVPVAEDGSALFRVPADTPLAIQALDAEGKAVQLMRSWYTAMPGETVACIGCHERTGDAPPPVAASGLPTAAAAARGGAAAPGAPAALARGAVEITPWRGPPRGFDFEREVQPVLDRHCAGCHDGRPRPDGLRTADLRSEREAPGYKGKLIADLGVQRMHPAMKAATGGFIRYTPAYDALLPYIRRVGVEDDVSLLVPGEYHADTSELVQMLKKGHQGVRLDAEAWDRLVTWIDLNAPCHGTWGDVFPPPTDAPRRRMEMRLLYGGPTEDPEAVPPPVPSPDRKVVGTAAGAEAPAPQPVRAPQIPAGLRPRLQAPHARAEAPPPRAEAPPPREKTIDLGGGVTMRLVRIPAGEFDMGDADGEPDEQPLARVVIGRPFWMGACEVTNAQFRRFDPSHDPRYFAKLHARADDEGLPLDGADQPAVRVSWRQAMAFCRWLTQRTGMAFNLPTEAQWEYACRAGSAAALSYGAAGADFSPWANVADNTFAAVKNVTGGIEHHHLHVSAPEFDDGAAVTAPVGRYKPNAWGLSDMHGNAAEWTRTLYRPYPYVAADGREDAAGDGPRVVRGGSFHDRPVRCRSAFRLSYPPWQRVFNVGLRVVAEEPAASVASGTR
ncbi:MAG: hypothetical protein FJ288_05675 [Planctomycetes bacterium]|nr:hypothetical protein [Planctomycetota bacterium]